MSLPAALNTAQDGDTVKVLANHVTNWSDVEASEYSTLAIVKKTLTLDLGGKAVDWLDVGEMVPDEEGGILESSEGNLTIVDSATATLGTIENLAFMKGTLNIQGGEIGTAAGGSTSGKLTREKNSGKVTITGGVVRALSVDEGASVTVSGGDGHNGRWDVSEGTLTITGGTFYNTYFSNNGGTIAISGGTFSAILNTDTSDAYLPAMELLAKGYAFYDTDAPTQVKDGSMRDYLRNVTVKSHDHTIENGKCACGLVANVSDSTGSFYSTLQAALDAAAADSGIQWVQLETDITENVAFDQDGKSVTLKMNGKTLAASDNSSPALTVSGGTLTFADDAKISNPKSYDYFAPREPAISLTGGKLVFTGKLTAQGGAYIGDGAPKKQEPAVYATGGELDFRDDLNLEGSLTVTGDAKLTNGLTKGTFCAVAEKRLSVEGSNNYKHVEALLADGYIFVDKNVANKYPCANASYQYWTGDVTIVAHKHTWARPETGDNYECTECGKICDHPDGYKDGKCPTCGQPCPHYMADQSPNDYNYYCNECHQQMFVRIQTDEHK